MVDLLSIMIFGLLYVITSSMTHAATSRSGLRGITVGLDPAAAALHDLVLIAFPRTLERFQAAAESSDHTKAV